MAIPENVLDILIGPLLTDNQRRTLKGNQAARYECLTRYYPRCVFCGDTDSDHLRFVLASTLESVRPGTLLHFGLPHRFLDENYRLATVCVACPSCIRNLRKETYYNGFPE